MRLDECAADRALWLHYNSAVISMNSLLALQTKNVSSFRSRRSLRNPRAAVLALIVVVIWALPTFAEFRIQAGDGVGAQFLPVGTTEIELFVIPGTAESVTGTPCVDGDGDELCAWQIGLETEGGLSLGSFVPDSPASTIWQVSSTTLKANGGNPASGSLAPEKIGTLTVHVSEEGRLLLSESSAGVGANLGLEPMSGEIVAVPEPTVLATLGAGCLLIAMWGAKRRR